MLLILNINNIHNFNQYYDKLVINQMELDKYDYTIKCGSFHQISLFSDIHAINPIEIGMVTGLDRLDTDPCIVEMVPLHPSNSLVEKIDDISIVSLVGG